SGNQIESHHVGDPAWNKPKNLPWVSTYRLAGFRPAHPSPPPPAGRFFSRRVLPSGQDDAIDFHPLVTRPHYDEMRERWLSGLRRRRCGTRATVSGVRIPSLSAN